MSHPRKKHIPSPSSKITSFFPPSGLTTTSAPSSSDPTSLRPPPPPPSIQSSLLNVGMRVRKSVPSGYKNKSPSPSSSQPTAPPPSSQQLYPTTSTTTTKPPSSAPATYRTRELVPFCGLHSVGGLTPGEDEVPPLVGSGVSWSTFSSSSSSENGRKKRGLEEEEEYGDEVEARLDAVFDEEERMRRIAPLRARRKDGMSGRGGYGAGVRVEGDFDDADVGFLTPMDVDEV